MVPDENDDTPDDASDDQSSQPSGLLDQLRSLVEALADIEEEGGHRHESGRIDRGNARIDYDYDVSIGLGRADRSSHDEEPSSDRFRSDQRSGQRGMTEDSIHVETREGTSGDELVVVADLPGVTDDDVDVALDTDEQALTLRVDDDVVERVVLDRPDVAISDMSLRNQVLEIRLARTSDTDGGEST